MRRVDFCSLTHCVLQHNAQEQATPFRPQENRRDGLERLRHTPFILYNTSDAQSAHMAHANLPGKSEECVVQAHTTGKPTRTNISPNPEPVLSLLKFCLLHGPYNALRSSISPIRGIRLNSIVFFAISRPLPIAKLPNQCGQKRSGTLTRDVLRNQEAHCCASLLRPSPTLLHLLQSFHNFSSCFIRRIQQNFWMKATAPHSRPCHVTSLAFSNSFFRQPRHSLLQTLQLFISPRLLFSSLVSSCHIANNWPILSSSPHIWPKLWHLLLPPSKSTLLLSTPLGW